MSASSLMSVKLDSEEKLLFAQNAEAIGLTPSAAVKVFVRRFNECGGFPFDVRLSPEPFASEAEACDFADAAARDVIDGAW